MGTKKGSKKRFWPDDEKRSICLQARAAGVSVAQVARRYAMNAHLIHNWLRDPRFASEEAGEEIEVATFLPVEVEGTLSAPSQPPSKPPPDALLSVQRVDITLSNGRRILVEGTTQISSVLALVKGLML
ncbi:transposase [Phaeobacter inhibens]|uniref:IS66-like element accessory protein TnpA n=1 Tax=Phaeobacter inhibens TaxID=221822 RepID=UPI0021A7A573|nr:transposase [Phaeobacter inhibens]UWR66100.1 transposase [Phaeobacter inhibens]